MIVLDYFTVDCIPCRMMNPVLARLQEEFPEVEFQKIDASKEKVEGITLVPTFSFLNNQGEEVKRLTGAISIGRFREILKALIRQEEMK